MAEISIIPLRPGLNLDDSDTAISIDASGKIQKRPGRGDFRYTDYGRFVEGFFQAVGGYETLSSTALSGVCRNMLGWKKDGNLLFAFGTHTHLQVFKGNTLYDITPIEARTGTLSGAISTTDTSVTVSVAHTAHGLAVDDIIQFSGVEAVGGITPNGQFTVKAVADADNYSFDFTSAATSTVGSAGGSAIAYKYFDDSGSETDVIDSTDTEAVFNFNITGHGRDTNDRFELLDDVSIAGVTLSGEYVVTKIDDDNFTITHSAAATSTVSGGGGTFRYLYYLKSGRINGDSGGFGTGPYGVGGYGTSDQDHIFPRKWSLEKWDDQLIANPKGKGIFFWSGDVTSRAIQIYNAPERADHVLVTPQHHVMAFGTNDPTTGEYKPYLARWTNQNNYEDWAVTETSQAGFLVLGQGGGFIDVVRARKNIIAFTGDQLITLTYEGNPNTVIYASDFVELAAPPISKDSVVTINGDVFWMTHKSGFYKYSNGTVGEIPCYIKQDIRDNHKPSQIEKVVAHYDKDVKEITWSYVDRRDNTLEISRLVGVNVSDFSWCTRTSDRTAWWSGAVAEYPVGVKYDGSVLYHEKGYTDENGGPIPWEYETVPISILFGENMADIDKFIPDNKGLQGGVDLTIKTKNRPADTYLESGPYSYNAATTDVSLSLSASFVSVREKGTGTPTYTRKGGINIEIQDSGMKP